MADYSEDIAKYTSSVDDAAVKAIVKHLGIALRNKDSSLVSCSDPSELQRVVDKWLKKKLALTDSDDDLAAAVSGVCSQMKGDNSKSRVTFYYLLAEKYDKLAELY